MTQKRKKIKLKNNKKYEYIKLLLKKLWRAVRFFE